MVSVPALPIEVGMVRTSLPFSKTLDLLGLVVGNRDVRIADLEGHRLVGLAVEPVAHRHAEHVGVHGDRRLAPSTSGRQWAL